MYKLLYSKNRSKKGFTLMEMLIVIAIIAILVAIIVPIMSGQTKEAKNAADDANARSITAMIAVECLEGSLDPADIDTIADIPTKAAAAFEAIKWNNGKPGDANIEDGVLTANDAN